jgi:hypothetical protein
MKYWVAKSTTQPTQLLHSGKRVGMVLVLMDLRWYILGEAVEFPIRRIKEKSDCASPLVRPILPKGAICQLI